MSLPEFDLYALQLVRLVAKHRGFTAASVEAGVSQSALTRQVQGIEERIGVKVFERTTRKVTLTEAGAILLRETEAMPNILSGALRRIREEYLDAQKVIKVGLSTSLARAHVPGILHGHRRTHSDVKVIVSQESERDIVQGLSAAKLDLGIVVDPEKLPSTVVESHRMEDRFCLSVPAGVDVPRVPKSFRKWGEAQSWLLPQKGTRSRELVDRWAEEAKLPLIATMELDDADLMNQLVAMGMGVALVPQRSLSGLTKRKQVQKVPLLWNLSRDLVVLAPRYGSIPEHVQEFIDQILFS